jgi:hypothetical protein
MEKNIKLQLPCLQIGSLVLDAVVVVGVVDVGDGADLHLPTLLRTKPWALEPDHVGTVILVEPRSVEFKEVQKCSQKARPSTKNYKAVVLKLGVATLLRIANFKKRVAKL